MSQLLDILESKYPIIQGPIGELNDPKMVAAVCEAGGFGMLALGFIQDLDTIKKMIAEIRERTDKPFGANLMIAMNPANEQILEVLAEAGVKTVTTSAGAPQRIYPKIHELGMKGLHVALDFSFAVKAAKAGADGVVVSGYESGGLRTLKPESSNMVLIPLVCDHVDVPVVAAGAIADSRGYRAALALGAQGVQIGTRFLSSAESPAPQAWKEAILNCPEGGTTVLPVGGMGVRVIMNARLAEKMKDPNVDLSKEYNMMNMGKAWRSGQFDLFPPGAGQVSAVVTKIKTVKEIIDEMVS
ncbi:MAG: nitronate monooxygenase [Deltaproteobacteria bacterium]|nr:nitronate monooxygenase [Deltaproteobacteria bacterium]MBW2103357.1 nitronate monooxygenase [Deltaproteobacteria bacterium]MBW2348653.1 nitronate monooxygenase [Deltaproteobacteria bacterium]RLB38224.1 MAG: nitronate monooxygenase [Deltaproteobacteria bacterium]